jgi:hypothetical protein
LCSQPLRDAGIPSNTCLFLISELPSCNEKIFHEEGHTGQVYAMYYSLMDVGIISPVDLQFTPTSLGKQAIKEKMINGFILPIKTQYTKAVGLNM